MGTLRVSINCPVADVLLILPLFLSAKTSMVGDGASGVGRSVADQLNELCGLGAAALAVCALTNPLCEAAGAFCAGLATGTWIREHIG